MGFSPFIVKNRFCSTVIGTFAVYLSIAFVTPLNNFSVYITSFIHIKQEFVTMHYGMFIHLIFSFGTTIANPLGGVLENYIGFLKTIYLGLLILLLGCIAFIYQQNIWLCYGLSLIMGMGTGISTSLLGKNLVFYVPNKKGMLTGAIGIGAVIISAAYTFGGEKIIN
jgi:MFS family permease